MGYSTRRFVLVLPGVILFLYFFSPLSIGVTSLGEERLILMFFFSYAYLICVCLVLSVSSSSWCLGRAAACACGIPWLFLLLFLYIMNSYMLLLSVCVEIII